MLIFSSNFTEKDSAVVQANIKSWKTKILYTSLLLFLFCEAYWVSPSVSGMVNYESWLGTIGWPSMKEISQETSEICGVFPKYLNNLSALIFWVTLSITSKLQVKVWRQFNISRLCLQKSERWRVNPLCPIYLLHPHETKNWQNQMLVCNTFIYINKMHHMKQIYNTMLAN